MSPKKARRTPSSPAVDREKLRKLEQRLADIDQKLLALFNRRAAVAHQLAESTEPAGPVAAADAAAADRQLVEALLATSDGPLTTESLRAVWRELASACRRLARPTRIGFLGPKFSYSHQAAVQQFGHSADHVPLGSIAAVFEEVAGGDVDLGLVPLENSTDGRISDTLQMFIRVPIRIAGEVHLRIHHNLLGTGPRAEVTHICSKPQALSQCRGWLAEHFPAAELVETPSTTVAAERALADPTRAAIASEQAAVHYGLEILAANIEDHPNNVTRFAVLAQQSARRTGRDKTSLLFQVLHQPGTLADVMGIFKRNRLNLTWIESFPLHDRNMEYFFFVEFHGHEKDLATRRAISALRKKTQVLELLGSYPAVPSASI